jgi:NADH:ubiquinone oxidoreductase subunit E
MMKHPGRGNSPAEMAISLPDAMREKLRKKASVANAAPRGAHIETVRRIVEAGRGAAGPLLPILHAVQQALGHVPADAVAEIAEGLNLSRAEVHGVLTYYHYFRHEPAGRHVLQICRAEACQAMGAEALWTHACDALALADAGTSADGSVTLEPVYCLGLCASSPAAALDERPHARLTPARVDALLQRARVAPEVAL